MTLLALGLLVALIIRLALTLLYLLVIMTLSGSDRAAGSNAPSIYISSPVCREPPSTCVEPGAAGGSAPAVCTRSTKAQVCTVDVADKIVFWTEKFEAIRDGHRWVWLDDQGYDVDGSGHGKVGSGASSGPQKVGPTKCYHHNQPPFPFFFDLLNFEIVK